MDLRQLRTFQMAAQTLSFTQTAAILNFAQSTVTAQIQALEEELGIQLFDRFGRRVYLSEAGKRFLEYADRMLALAEEAQSILNGEAELGGSLSISAPETVFTYRLPPYLRQFRDRCPNTRLHYQPRLDVDGLRGLLDGSIDVAFLLQEGLDSDSLISEPLIEEPLLVVAAGDHPLARRDVVRPGDLKGETILLTESGCGYRHLFEGELARGGVHPLARLEFSSIEAIKQCVIAGLGVAFLPEVAVQEQIRQGRLAALRWEKTYGVSVQMVRHKEKWLSPVLSEFLQTCRGMKTIP